MVAIMTVLAFPPKLSCKSLVNLESLYGIWDPFLPSTNDDITFPNAVKDKLILVASTNLSPIDPVLFCLSDPAKSTKLNLEPINLFCCF